MAGDTEIELKFQVPASSRAALLAELCRLPVERSTLSARYLDTPDRRLARKGLAWRLRREGRRWVQTLKAGGASPLERFEHEVILAEPRHDPTHHAGTPAGERLLRLLRHGRDGHGGGGREVGVRFQTSVRRTSRRVRSRGALVEVSFDEGRLTAADGTQRIREVEFECLSGSPAAMVALAERWRRRFGLIYDPRSKAERGDRLAEGSPHPPVRKAAAPSYDPDATALQACAAVLDECLAQVSHNAIGLVEGDPAQRVEHVHQMRVGIRRLRSALRCFEGWVPAPPPELVEKLRGVFARLGEVREADVLGSGVAAALALAGAPPLGLPAGSPGPDPADIVRSADTQQLLLAWIGWLSSLPSLPSLPSSQAAAAHAGQADEPRELRRRAEKRLRRWHRRLAHDCARFDELDETGLHTLRKRIKRQRYAVEFLAPVLRRKAVQRYLDGLAPIQERMGELNDLFLARDRYHARVEQEPGAWFALGWLAARTQQLRSLARSELERAVKVDPPSAGRGGGLRRPGRSGSTASA